MILGFCSVGFARLNIVRPVSNSHTDMHFRGSSMNHRPKAQNLRQLPHATEVEARRIEPEDPERWDGLA